MPRAKIAVLALQPSETQFLAIVTFADSERHLQRYFSISDAQFRVIDKGAALGSSTFVLIRNR